MENPGARYKPNPAFGGRKEKDGFVCSGRTTHSFVYCVAVKIGEKGVKVRDTKDVSDTTLSFTKKEWRIFIQGVKEGEFDI